jgi:hypothetical protein
MPQVPDVLEENGYGNGRLRVEGKITEIPLVPSTYTTTHYISVES